MMALLRFLLTLPFLILLILFAIANRQIISFTWSPFHPPLEMPLAILTLGMMATGFLIGAGFSWFAMGHVRAERRRQEKALKKLESLLDAANENLVQVPPPEHKDTHG